MRHWSSKSYMEETGIKLGLQPWISEKPALTSSRSYVKIFHGLGSVEDKGSQKRLTFNHFFQAQDGCIPKSKKSNRGGRRPTWMSKELMKKLKIKKKVYGMWKMGLAT